MQLHKGFEQEYKKRHDALWPELRSLLKESSIQRYSIFLDEPSGVLFAVMEVEDPTLLQSLPEHPVMRKWWAYMADIMETHPDSSPLSVPLKEVFYLS